MSLEKLEKTKKRKSCADLTQDLAPRSKLMKILEDATVINMN